jgi:predicted RNase H-like nuclease
MNLLGLDLAWRVEANPSGLAVWQTHDAHGERLPAPRAVLADSLIGEEALADALTQHAGQACVLAVDAPLVLTNQQGQRAAEAELNAVFRRHGAGAHPSNLSLYPEAETARLAQRLQREGFDFLPVEGAGPSRTQRWMAEVYPHPAQITLLGRERIVRYKRGRVDERRARMAEYQDLLWTRLAVELPGFVAAPVVQEALAPALPTLRGRALKAREDMLDACFCLLIAARLAAGAPQWRFGAPETGVIVVPKS